LAKIIHTSTGASNSPRELIVTPKIVGVPTGKLYLWTDENDYIEHTTFSGRIASVLNQVANPSPNVSSLICSGYDPSGNGREYPTVDGTQFDGINCLKFVAPSGSYGRTRLYLNRDSSYSDPYTGTTTSGLIKIVGRSGSFGEGIPLPGWGAAGGAAGVTFYCPPVANGQWQYQTDIYSFTDVGNPGDVPDPVNEWHLFTTVVQTSPTRIARLYIDGEKVFDVSLSSSPFLMTQHNDLYILNRSSNPINGIFTGYVAHTAAWVRPLSDSEVLRYWDVIKNKYGL
jgi:hypothetical protein